MQWYNLFSFQLFKANQLTYFYITILIKQSTYKNATNQTSAVPIMKFILSSFKASLKDELSNI